jgi:hypothetical protein
VKVADIGAQLGSEAMKDACAPGKVAIKMVSRAIQPNGLIALTTASNVVPAMLSLKYVWDIFAVSEPNPSPKDQITFASKSLNDSKFTKSGVHPSTTSDVAEIDGAGSTLMMLVSEVLQFADATVSVASKSPGFVY